MWYITCLNEWKHFRRQFSIFVSTTFYLIVYLFCLYFCFLWHFEIINSIVNSLIATSMYFLCRCNWKEKTWQVLFWTSKFGRPNRYTGLPNYLDTSLAVWNIKPADWTCIDYHPCCCKFHHFSSASNILFYHFMATIYRIAYTTKQIYLQCGYIL